jgi:CBS domain-containing protein
MDARVSAFMRPDPPTLPHGATLADAIEVMVSHRIDGVPIVNDQGALVGLMTKTLALREINQRGRGDAPVRAIMKTDPSWHVLATTSPRSSPPMWGASPSSTRVGSWAS